MGHFRKHIPNKRQALIGRRVLFCLSLPLSPPLPLALPLNPTLPPAPSLPLVFPFSSQAIVSRPDKSEGTEVKKEEEEVQEEEEEEEKEEEKVQVQEKEEEKEEEGAHPIGARQAGIKLPL